jgi:hypothetical protein
MTGLQEFAKRFTKLDPAVGYVAVAFLIACIYPVLFLRDDVLGKIVMVSAIIAATMYHPIAGIIALIVVIAMLNQKPNKEGMLNSIPTLPPSNPLVGSTPSSSPSSVSFKTPDEFRQKYCTKEKAVADDLGGQGRTYLSYMLNPSFFSTLDANGNPQWTDDETNAMLSMDPDSFKQCKPLTTHDGGSTSEQWMTINNMCDPACNWTIKPTPTPTPTPTTTTEGFTPMLRPHIRTGRRMITDGMDALKSNVNRLKRQLF